LCWHSGESVPRLLWVMIELSGRKSHSDILGIYMITKISSYNIKKVENSTLKRISRKRKGTTSDHHIALLFFANLFFCSPSSLKLLNPKKLLFFFCGLG
jgi:hypothetical protein